MITRTVILNNQAYDVTALFARIKRRKVEFVPIQSIKGMNRNRKYGFSPKSRLPQADTSFPLILDERNRLIDGRHRLAKLQDSGKTKARIIRVTKHDLNKVRINDKCL